MFTYLVVKEPLALPCENIQEDLLAETVPIFLNYMSYGNVFDLSRTTFRNLVDHLGVKETLTCQSFFSKWISIWLVETGISTIIKSVKHLQ